jgi:general secretion pathway protein E
VSEPTENDRKEYLKKLGLERPEGELPPEERKNEDRRRTNAPAAAGNERRKGERRKTRSTIGRERYLDMVLKERTLFAQQGLTRSAEQLLSASGAGSENEAAAAGERDSATGDQLRALLPVQTWLPLSIHLISLDKGTLTIAPLHDLTERQSQNLKNAALRTGFKVEKIDTQLWDRADLLKTLHTVHDLSADRCEKTLSVWLSDIDNGLLLNQFQRDMLAEALQMRASDIHMVQDNAPDAPNWIKYRIDGDLVPIHLLPADDMATNKNNLKSNTCFNGR